MRISDWSSDVCSSDLLKERTAPFDCLAGAQDRLRQAQGGRIRGKTMTQDIGSALEQLESVVRDRLAAPDASASYVASLAAKGRGKIAQKPGEEATETIIAPLTEADAAPTRTDDAPHYPPTVLLPGPPPGRTHTNHPPPPP